MIPPVVRSIAIGFACIAGIAIAPAIARAETAPPAEAARPDSVAVPLPPPRVRHWQVGLLRPDRMQHVSLSMTLGLGAGLVTRSPRVAAWGSLALGLAKELYDIRRTGFDPVDLSADCVGSGAAALGTRIVEH
jgi:hypothetical protein